MRKIIYSFVGLIVFYFLAISSSVIKLSSIPSSQNSVVVKSHKRISIDYTNKVFCILKNNLLADSEISSIEMALSNNQIQVVDIENAKQIYLEQKLNNNTSKTKIDYYIYVEQVDQKNNYYYQLIDARSYKVSYARKINELSFENLMSPFVGTTQTIDLSFIKYFKTPSNNDYNKLLESNNYDLLMKRSDEIIAEGKGKSFPAGSKKKDEQKYYNDLYAILLNYATLKLLARDFNSCREALKNARTMSTISPKLTHEDIYISQLTKTALKWSTAIEDSVNSVVPENGSSKLSINISNNVYEDNGFNRYKKLMYSHIVTVLFSEQSHKLDIYERDLIDNILTSNTEVTKKAEGSTEGADFLLSVTNSFLSSDVREVVSFEVYKDFEGNQKERKIVKYQYNVNASANIKITRNKDAIILGVIPVDFKRNDLADDYTPYGIFELLSKLFDDGRFKNFLKSKF